MRNNSLPSTQLGNETEPQLSQGSDAAGVTHPEAPSASGFDSHVRVYVAIGAGAFLIVSGLVGWSVLCAHRLKVERQVWAQTNQRNDEIGYEDYLGRYPHGRFADSACAAVKTLQCLATTAEIDTICGLIEGLDKGLCANFIPFNLQMAAIAGEAVTPYAAAEFTFLTKRAIDSCDMARAKLKEVHRSKTFSSTYASLDSFSEDMRIFTRGWWEMITRGKLLTVASSELDRVQRRIYDESRPGARVPVEVFEKELVQAGLSSDLSRDIRDALLHNFWSPSGLSVRSFHSVRDSILAKVFFELNSGEAPRVESILKTPPRLRGKARFLRKNDQGYEEYLWKKDSSVMIRIPAGTFIMGSDSGSDDEKPVHRPCLSEFYIDKYEVTNRQFKQFCDATGRKYPDDPGFTEVSCYIRDCSDCPVVDVSWADAKSYAAWDGKSLPTEAQWEKAARGTDGQEYPWGNKKAIQIAHFVEPGQPTTLPEYEARMVLLEMGDSRSTGPRSGSVGTKSAGPRPRPVGANAPYFLDTGLLGGRQGKTETRPSWTASQGVSPYGATDMAFSVDEWCEDRYGPDYYKHSPDRDPRGPSAGSERVKRGDKQEHRCARRNSNRDNPATTLPDLGFRCAVGGKNR